jgi:DNA-directed RNA polymerase subunit RPC12/RpoP
MIQVTSSGWTCTRCGSRRIRTVVVEDAPNDPSRADSFETRCPACGHPELVMPSRPGERVRSVRYVRDV